MENSQELELYLRKVRAGFGKRLVVTIFDLFYLLCMLFPVFITVTLWDNGGWVATFHKIAETPQVFEAKRCFLFSLIVISVLYIYFVFIPSTSDYQTFFGNSFAIKAIDISNGFDINARPSQMQLFKLNAIPIFLLPIVNATFFATAWAWGGEHAKDWYSNLFKAGNRAELLDAQMKYENRFDSSIRILFVGMFFLQMFYLFTVATSKKALNWFTKSTGVIYVDLEKLEVLQQKDTTFVKPVFEFPGARIEYESVNPEEREEEFGESESEIIPEEIIEEPKTEITEEELPSEVIVNE